MSKPVVDFTQKAVKEYLDNCIKFWRDKQKNIKPSHNYPSRQDLANLQIERDRCMAYIDAFQSVRKSLFDEILGTMPAETEKC